MAGVWNEMSFEISSNPKYSVIPWFYDFRKFEHQCDWLTQEGSMALLPEFPGVCYFWFSADRLWAICASLLPGRTDFNLTLPHKPKRKICMWKSWLWQLQYHQGEELSMILADTLHRGCQGCKGSRKHRSPHWHASAEIVLSLHSECFWWVLCKHFQAVPKNKWRRWLQVISPTTHFRFRASFWWRKLKKEINKYSPCFPIHRHSQHWKRLSKRREQ